MTEQPARYDAVVLAGGASRRLGGVDKALLTVGAETLLDRVVAACAHAGSLIIVGPERTIRPDPLRPGAVRWTRERPAGGGPVAALDAALPYCTEAVTLLLAVDLPFVTLETARRLVAGIGGRDGAVLVDGDGRDQPLVAAYRTAPLAKALDACRADDGALAGVPMRAVLAQLTLTRLPDVDGATFDCDTWPALRSARSGAREDGHRDG